MKSGVVALPAQIRVSMALALLCAGCVSVSKHLVSEPKVYVEGTSIAKSGWIQTDEMTLAVRPHNTIDVGWSRCSVFGTGNIDAKKQRDFRYNLTYYGGKLASETNYFIVELLIAPLRSQGVIDFDKVFLKMAPDRVVKPSSYFDLEPRYGVSVPWFEHFGQLLCKPKQQPSYSATNPLSTTPAKDTNHKFPLREDHGYCFALKYNVPPPRPTSSFMLDIEGLSVGSSNISLPIMYSPAVRTYNHSCVPTL